MTQQLIDRLKEIVGEEFVKENENMASTVPLSAVEMQPFT